MVDDVDPRAIGSDDGAFLPLGEMHDEEARTLTAGTAIATFSKGAFGLKSKARGSGRKREQRLQLAARARVLGVQRWGSRKLPLQEGQTAGAGASQREKTPPRARHLSAFH